ncbi:MAG TPA: ATP-binding cassette domain-containing protein, partial [Burkholderiaceae bacterium]|nr:ATP-binding cassette domain-containing protein [Burkholderiaceae bacterium]
GGQQQRVALARALAREPRVLLLDEPFSAVDQVTRERLYEELANLRRQLQMPVVLVTHSLQEAAMLADRMCVLHRGKTLQTGAPPDVLARPASLDVARLVSIKNIGTATVAGYDSQQRATLLDWRGLPLQAAPQPQRAAGHPVHWAVPASGIVLHRRDRPSFGSRENPVPGRITACIRLGDQWQITLAPAHAPDEPLTFSLSAHVAQRNTIAVGVDAAVSLLKESVWIVDS